MHIYIDDLSNYLFTSLAGNQMVELTHISGLLVLKAVAAT